MSPITIVRQLKATLPPRPDGRRDRVVVCQGSRSKPPTWSTGTHRVGPARGEAQSHPYVWTICRLSSPGTHSSDIRDDEPAAEPRADLEHGADERRARRPTAPRDRRAP